MIRFEGLVERPYYETEFSLTRYAEKLGGRLRQARSEKRGDSGDLAARFEAVTRALHDARLCEAHEDLFQLIRSESRFLYSLDLDEEVGDRAFAVYEE